MCCRHDFSRTEVRGQGKGHNGPKQNATLPRLKMYPQTKFGIPSSNSIGDMFRTWFSRTEARGQGHSIPRCIHTKDYYVKWYKRYALDTFILELRPDESKSQRPQNSKWHSLNPRYIHTPGSLRQLIWEIWSGNDLKRSMDTQDSAIIIYLPLGA